MDENLKRIKIEVYDKCRFNILNYRLEIESKEYEACKFELNGENIISRSAKITPKKIGQFVTFWKRNKKGIIEPFNEIDLIDFYIINIQFENKLGQFVFPKSILIEKGIISTKKKEGKRGFRVYPIWDDPNSKQAQQAQKWQLKYFYQITDNMDLNRVVRLYKNE